MKKIIALVLALIFAMNFAVVSFAGVAQVAAEDESIVVVEETVEGEEIPEDTTSSIFENDFMRLILDLIEILKSAFKFLDKISNK